MITEPPLDPCRENGHDRCLLCGERNPWSLKLWFRDDGAGGVRTGFLPNHWLQGYDGILHGGVVSALLDAAMTHCLFHRNVRAVTGDLRVRFVHPVSCRDPLELKAWVVSAAPRLFRMKAELIRGDLVVAWAEARFVRMAPGGSQAELIV